MEGFLNKIHSLKAIGVGFSLFFLKRSCGSTSDMIYFTR